MSTESRRRDVVVAEYNYRHEAEFAAGFLDHAGIPYRLQTDDAGGIDIGVGMGRPARLWVRGEDAEEARELLEVTPNAAVEPSADEEGDPPASGLFIGATETSTGPIAEATNRRLPERPSERASELGGVERGVSVILGAAFLALGSGLGGMVPEGSLGDAWTLVMVLLGVSFLLSGVLGRAWGPLLSILRALSGVAP